MTADRVLLDAFEQVFGPQDWDRPRTYDPTADLDEDTLRRSRIAPMPASMTYRRRVDMPREPWVDEIAVATGDYREEQGR